MRIVNKPENGKTEQAWNELFGKYGITDCVRRDGSFRISAEQIKEFREPRLMAKFDHRKNLPSVFKSNGLGILPISRGDYLIGPFDLFAPLPEPGSGGIVQKATLPAEVASISPNAIFSEPVALNCAWNAGILQSFLGEERLFPTLTGRMGAKPFEFYIGSIRNGGMTTVAVNGAQIEVDAAYEGDSSLTIIEAKMDLAEDFIVRQLYYPYRHFSMLPIHKSVRTVFLTYSAGIFSLSEYGFTNPDNYSSAVLLKTARYSLDSAVITLADLIRLMESTKPVADAGGIPFPQADTFERVINLCERLTRGPMTKEDIEEAYGFDPRQADYYFNAAAYLGLAKREGGKGSRVVLSDNGRALSDLPLARRNMRLADLILRHRAFRETFRLSLAQGSIPDKNEIREILLKTNPGLGNPDGETYARRASTIRHWTQWLLSLPNEAS